MNKIFLHICKSTLNREKGQALVIVLVMLLIGSLTLVPLLNHATTALKSGMKYEKKTDKYYAADAGIEDAMWQIKYDGLESLYGSEYFNYDFNSIASYPLNDPVNNVTTNVTIQNVWMPSNVNLDSLGLTPAMAKSIIERPLSDNTTNRLVVNGTPLDEETYRIKIEFYPGIYTSDNLSVSSIGIWLPHGFTYNGSCNLATFEGTEDKYTETVETRPGGQAVVWDFSLDPIPFPDLPPEELEPTDNPQTAEIYFNYISSDATARPNAIAWIVTAGSLSSDIPISWDIDTRFYKLISEAEGTKVEAYTSRSELANMYASTPGDYVAIGNSLMTDESYPYNGQYRNYLWPSSSTTLSSLPDDAYISKAYLYWSGFFSSGFSTPYWGPDYCSDMDNWQIDDQTRVPTEDGDTLGTWSTSPCWDDVDETSPNDADYFTGTETTGGEAYQLFTFSPFSMPSGADVTELTIYVRARDTSYGTNNIRSSIKVNGTLYHTDVSSVNPSTSWNTYSFSYSTNPATGSAWTVDDINGTGSNPLEQFGIYTTDLSPDIRVSMVYAEADCSSCWSVYSSEFRGDADSSASDTARTLTLKNCIDLSSQPAGTTIVEWLQSTSQYLEGESDPVNCDRLQFQFSKDNGNTWSGYITAFTGSMSGTRYYYYVIPQEYLTSQFLLRFYLDGFNGSSEYCDIDEIAIARITGTPDTAVDFTVNGYDIHTEEVNALVSQLIGNYMKPQYSYACRAEVTDLVNAHSERNSSGEPIGNAEYTVGNVQATPAGSSYELAYAGWSLVLIYHSSSTAGRQLFLWNNFAYSSGGQNLDFDRDGSPGGTIKGFIVPNQIEGETEAAKFTAFVAEGDEIYSGDSIAFNSETLWDGSYSEAPSTYGDPHLPNNEDSPYNVWNSKSVGITKDGVDIDTFRIPWSSGLLHPGDTQAQIDLPTQIDNYNLVYFIMSVRSKTVLGGTEHYLIED